MSGYSRLKDRMKENYKNIKDIGLTIAELTSVEPVTLTVKYGASSLDFVKFHSAIGLEGLEEKDIGKKQYFIFVKGRDDMCYILSEFEKFYNEFFPLDEGEGEE